MLELVKKGQDKTLAIPVDISHETFNFLFRTIGYLISNFFLQGMRDFFVNMTSHAYS